MILHNENFIFILHYHLHGGSRRIWQDNVKIDLQEVGRAGKERIALAGDRERWRALVSAVVKLQVP